MFGPRAANCGQPEIHEHGYDASLARSSLFPELCDYIGRFYIMVQDTKRMDIFKGQAHLDNN